MKIKVFLIVCVGSILMLVLSSALVYTQMRSVRAVSLEPLADSLYQEDAKILAWMMSTIPIEQIDTLKLPESWAEIFLVNTDSLELSASTNQAHKGIPLYRHPLLLDQASVITDAIRTGTSSTKSTPAYVVIIEPAGPGRILVGLKPKAWEKGLVSKQAQEIESSSMNIALTLGVFLMVGLLITLVVSFLVAKTVVTPTRNAFDALEALSLGNFDYDLQETPGKEMTGFAESYLRLKASLEMALDMITRR